MTFLKVTKRRGIIVAIVSFLLTLTTVFGYQIEHHSEVSMDMFTAMIIILVFSGTLFLLLFVYNLFDKVKVKTGKYKEFAWWKVYLFVLLCFLVIYAIQFLAVYPGLFVFDSEWQYSMYVKNEISEHHPVLHTVVFGWIIDFVHRQTDAFNHGVAAYMVLQIGICALCISYFVTFLFKKLKSKCSLVLMILFFGFYPPLVLAVVSSTKDTLFMAFLLVVVALTIELLEDSERFVKKSAKLVLWVISTLLIIILRNNCIYAIPFFVVALFLYKKEKKLIMGVLFGAVLFLYALYKMFFVPYFVTEEVNGKEKYSVPVQQLMRIYHNEEADITQEERALIERLVDEKARNNYNPKISDMAKAGLDMEYYRENSAEINKMYISLVLRNFKMSVESFLENTCGFWYPGCELTLYMDGTKGYWAVGCYQPAYSNPKIKPLFAFYELFRDSDFVTKNPVTSLLFAPATFFYLFAIMFAYAIDQKKKTYMPVLIFVFALWGTYLLGPVALVRYVIFLYAIVPLYFAMIREREEDTLGVADAVSE